MKRLIAFAALALVACGGAVAHEDRTDDAGNKPPLPVGDITPPTLLNSVPIHREVITLGFARSATGLRRRSRPLRMQ